jgi:hypothetical protein
MELIWSVFTRQMYQSIAEELWMSPSGFVEAGRNFFPFAASDKM